MKARTLVAYLEWGTRLAVLNSQPRPVAALGNWRLLQATVERDGGAGHHRGFP
jgi:hypothetical protein